MHASLFGNRRWRSECAHPLAFLRRTVDIRSRKAGGLAPRQPGQVRKEAAATSFPQGSFSFPPSISLANALYFPLDAFEHA